MPSYALEPPWLRGPVSPRWEEYQDRLANDFALLLTAVAYKFVAAAGLPVLSYLTFLDKVRETPSWPRSWANFSLF